MGDLIDLEQERERRKTEARRTATTMPADPRLFMFGLAGYVRLTSNCDGVGHVFVNPPGYCECGKEYSDGTLPSTGAFTEKDT